MICPTTYSDYKKPKRWRDTVHY